AGLAGEPLEAAAWAMRAAERARGVGLSEWADALTSFARAEGDDLEPETNVTTPSPAPAPSMPSPRPFDLMPKVPKPHNPDATEEDVEPIDLSVLAAEIAPELARLAVPRAPSPLPPKPPTVSPKPPTV